jgi:hypothetical protein
MKESKLKIGEATKTKSESWLNWRNFAIALTAGLLIARVFYPKQVVLDRSALAILGLIAVLALWPTLRSGKVPFIFDIKRKVGK